MQIKDNLLEPSLPCAGRTCDTFSASSLARRLRTASARVIALVSCGLALMAPLAAPAHPLREFRPGTSSALVITPASPVVFLAEVDLKEALKSFLEFLSWVLIVLGVCLVAYGAILIAQGRHLDGVVAIVAGFILVLAVPIIYYFAKLAGTQF